MKQYIFPRSPKLTLIVYKITFKCFGLLRLTMKNFTIFQLAIRGQNVRHSFLLFKNELCSYVRSPFRERCPVRCCIMFSGTLSEYSVVASVARRLWLVTPIQANLSLTYCTYIVCVPIVEVLYSPVRAFSSIFLTQIL